VSFNELPATDMTNDDKAKLMMLMGTEQFENEDEVGYKLEGKSGVFRLHQVGERCDMIWTRKKGIRPVTPGETLGFQINTESLFDLALLSRELSDLVEQVIAIEIAQAQKQESM